MISEVCVIYYLACHDRLLNFVAHRLLQDKFEHALWHCQECLKLFSHNIEVELAEKNEWKYFVQNKFPASIGLCSQMCDRKLLLWLESLENDLFFNNLFSSFSLWNLHNNLLKSIDLRLTFWTNNFPDRSLELLSINILSSLLLWLVISNNLFVQVECTSKVNEGGKINYPRTY